MTFFLLSLLLLAFISLLVAQAAPFPFHNPLPTSTSTPSSVLPSSPSYTTHYERVRGVPYSVSYDERAILINGERVLLLSGSVHYPRFAEAEWAHQLNLTRMSGLNMVQTYVFWNWHEPVKRQYDFTSESHNLGKFLQLAADFGLFVYLRIGPFICSEWAYGGIPLWMREDKSIVYRTNDTKWEYEMTVFVNLIMKYVQPYLARNGQLTLPSHIPHSNHPHPLIIHILSLPFPLFQVDLLSSPRSKTNTITWKATIRAIKPTFNGQDSSLRAMRQIWRGECARVMTRLLLCCLLAMG